MPTSPANPFKGRHYAGEVILSAVRWYLRYPLAYQHVSELWPNEACSSMPVAALALGVAVDLRDNGNMRREVPERISNLIREPDRFRIFYFAGSADRSLSREVDF